MSPFLLRYRLLLGAMVLSLPLGASGSCGSRTACFAFTQTELDLNAGSCPAPSDALAGFTDPSCPGPIVSVDGPGTFDGEICCYPVTYEDIQPDCGMSLGGAGGAGVGTVTPIPPGVDVATSTVSTGTGLGCSPSCNFSLSTGQAPCMGTPDAFYAALQDCAGCFDGTEEPCFADCPALCNNQPGVSSDDACVTCLQSNCQVDFSDCEQN